MDLVKTKVDILNIYVKITRLLIKNVVKCFINVSIILKQHFHIS